jgi:hypothetical protein
MFEKLFGQIIADAMVPKRSRRRMSQSYSSEPTFRWIWLIVILFLLFMAIALK